MDEKISVIVPFYKTPIMKFRLCIESFLNQSYKNFELLLVDDGNETEYRSVCEEYAGTDNRVKYIKQKNEGVSTARNNGMNKATGDYIVFCDSDDYVDSNFLDVMYRNIQGYELVICGVCEQWFPSNDSSVDMKTFYSMPTQYNWLQYVNFTPNKIFRKSIIDDNRIKFDPDVRLGEDALFVYEYLKHCSHIRCIKNMMYHYVWNDKSAVHTYDARYWQWEQRVITLQYEMFHQFPLNNSEHEFMLRWLYIKLKACLYYYLSNEKNSTDKKKYIQEIINYKYFNNIFENYNSNRWFGKGDKAILFVWKLLGEKGIKLTHWYSTHRG